MWASEVGGVLALVSVVLTILFIWVAFCKARAVEQESSQPPGYVELRPQEFLESECEFLTTRLTSRVSVVA